MKGAAIGRKLISKKNNILASVTVLHSFILFFELNGCTCAQNTDGNRKCPRIVWLDKGLRAHLVEIPLTQEPPTPSRMIIFYS